MLRERLYDIDDLWQLVCEAEHNDKHFELIDGELFEMSPTGEEHGLLAAEIARHIGNFAVPRVLGRVTVETGYYPPDDRWTLLGPSAAFTRKERVQLPLSKKYVARMPDIAVQIASFCNPLDWARRKVPIYLQHGTQLVWIVQPDKKGIEVCRPDADTGFKCEFIGADGTLSGEGVLPGFTLEMARLFA